MSKAKAYTKMILERLQKKTQHDLFKSNSSSNQKTQATPSDHRHPHNIKAFFDRFQTQFAVYHEPVRERRDKKALKRPLFFELSEIQHKSKTSSYLFKKESKSRLQTEPFVSEFKAEQPRKSGMRVVSKDFIRENKSMVVRKVQEKPVRTIQSNTNLQNRYKSLKTLPSRSTVYEPVNYRRMLVSPNSLAPVRQSIQRREPKYDRKRISPRKDLMHRCESYERFYFNK